MSRSLNTKGCLMAKLAGSEAVIWRQAEQIRRLRQDCLDWQKVVAVLAIRQAGVLVIDYAELARLPSGTVVQSEYQPDGYIVIRAVTGEPGQPGSAG